MQTEGEDYLVQCAASFGETAILHNVHGMAGPAICENALLLGIDLVIMATHGRGPASRLLLGSVSDYVVRHGSSPVLLLHSQAQAGALAERPFREILVAMEHSDVPEATLQPAASLAQATGAGLTLLTILAPIFQVSMLGNPYPTSWETALTKALSAAETEKLDGVAKRLRTQGIAISTRAVAAADSVAASLVGVLAEPAYDAMAIATHRSGGMRRLVLGSVVDKVIRGAGKPILVLRP